jgi:enoyl-CoA hydratase/carnithine racemase
MDDAVLFEVSDGIATITLNRPEARNPVGDPDVQEALLVALERLEAEPGIRVGILTGAGTAFSSGGNVKRMDEASAGPAARTPMQSRRHYRKGIQRLPLAFERVEVPIVAAVNGPAVGAGCDLACMCDIRIAAASARFAESFVKLGIIPGDGGAWLLPRVVGFARASEMALTGDMLGAEEALAAGLVSRVVPDGELMQAARGIAARIAANPPEAVRMTRRLLREAWNRSLDSILEYSAAMQAVAHTTDDHKEAMAAVREKRAPLYTGR